MFVPPKQAVGVLPEHIRAAHAIADFHATRDLLRADVVGEIPAVALVGDWTAARAVAAAPDEVQPAAGDEQIRFIGFHFARGRDGGGESIRIVDDDAAFDVALVRDLARTGQRFIGRRLQD